MNETHPSPAPNSHWFHLRYNASAPIGLPPIIRAARVLRYADDTGTWVVALWDKADPNDAISTCILRIPASQVDAVTRHPDMGAAAAQSSPLRSTFPTDHPADQGAPSQ